MPKTPEGYVKAAIMEYLAAKRIFAVRMNSGMQIGTHKGKNWAIRMNAPGTADILALPICCVYGVRHSVPLWIECKAAKGKQSEVQKSFQAQVEAEGHFYILARSIEDVEAALKGAL